MNRSAKLHASLAVCIFLFIGLGLALIRPGLTDYPPYLSFSPDVDGIKGLRLLLEEEGANVKEWRLPPERLPDGSGQLYIAVQPFGVTHESAKTWREWAEQGNDVVLFGANPHWIDGWKTVYMDPDEADGQVTAEFTEGVEETFDAEVSSEIRLKPAEDLPQPVPFGEQVLIWDAEGVLAVKQTAGRGSVTLALTSDWLMNENILEKSHFELTWRLLGGEVAGRTIYFDEYHHGYSISPGITQVYPLWLLAGLLQAGLAAAAWLWWKGKRFGPVYTPRAFTVRRGDETLLAAAGWYRRGRLSFEALNYEVEHLIGLLQVRSGVPAHPNAAQIVAGAQRLAEGRGQLPKGLPEVLARWEELRRKDEANEPVNYSEKEWLEDSVVLDVTLRMLEEAK